jgi:predicted O-methyltransferase YrrM
MKRKLKFKHWTPRYVFHRVLLTVYQSQHADHPWLTSDSIEILTTLLRPDDSGLEMGSGRSTIWLANRVGHLISIEHHGPWYERVSRIIQDQHIGNVEYNKVALGKPYVDFVKALADHSFDFILVDGPERDQCAVACTSKLKPGGILIVDNANMYLPHVTKSPFSRGNASTAATPIWAEFAELVQTWRLIWTSNGVWDTAIWVKPIHFV